MFCSLTLIILFDKNSVSLRKPRLLFRVSHQLKCHSDFRLSKRRTDDGKGVRDPNVVKIFMLLVQTLKPMHCIQKRPITTIVVFTHDKSIVTS